MTFDEIETHEFDDGSSISVGPNRHGEPMLVMDGAGGLETVIRFNRVGIKHDHIEFRREAGGPSTPVTGTIEGDPGNYGDVGVWLIEHQDQRLDDLGVA